jgi:hypothetical protein
MIFRHFTQTSSSSQSKAQISTSSKCLGKTFRAAASQPRIVGLRDVIEESTINSRLTEIIYFGSLNNNEISTYEINRLLQMASALYVQHQSAWFHGRPTQLA